MILFCGIPSEPSLGMVIDAVRKLGAPHLVFHQREFASANLEFQINGTTVEGTMELQGRSYPLEDFTAIYSRLMDYRLLPEIESEPPDSPIRFHCAAIHDTLMRWYEITPGLVLNRNADVGVNYSKPYQAQLIQKEEFAIPETLITNDPRLVREFHLKQGPVIYKSISQIRSIVNALEDADLDRLASIRSCPIQFQEYIPGANLRVHTINDQAFATKITTTATDYRYAYLEGEDERLEAAELDDELARRCIALAKALGLGFAGIDLKITPDDEIYCLEVNPCPAFSYYQRHTAQPIAEAVAAYLAQTVEVCQESN
ncbi:MAG: ATP-grasp domain-containing protein [Woeseiaceae bacterium]